MKQLTKRGLTLLIALTLCLPLMLTTAQPETVEASTVNGNHVTGWKWIGADNNFDGHSRKATMTTSYSSASVPCTQVLNYLERPISDLQISERLAKHLNQHNIYNIEQLLSSHISLSAFRLGEEYELLRQQHLDLGEDILDDHRIDEWRTKEPFFDYGRKTPDTKTMKRLYQEISVVHLTTGRNKWCNGEW